MNKSLRKVFFIFSAAGLIFLITSFTISGSINKDKNYTTLLHKVDSLTTRVANLEQRVKKLEDQRLSVVVPRHYFRGPYGKTPPDWREYQFNGRPYYAVPIQKEVDNGIKKLKK